MNKISFIIPVCNEYRTIEKAINEVLLLKKIKKQIIIVDNASTDGTRKIIKKFYNKKNVQIIFNKINKGYGNSIIKSLKLVNGKFIYIQYADLEYDIRVINKMLEITNKFNLDAVFGSRLLNIKNYLILFSKLQKKPSYLATIICTFLINIFYKRKFTDIIGAKFYRTSSIKKIKLKSLGQNFDFELVSKMIKKNYKIRETLVKYNQRKIPIAVSINRIKEKKIKFYHLFFAIFIIIKIKFFE